MRTEIEEAEEKKQGIEKMISVVKDVTFLSRF
jgi:hypothetical protein